MESAAPETVSSDPSLVAHEGHPRKNRGGDHQRRQQNGTHACAQGLGHHGDDCAGHNVENRALAEHFSQYSPDAGARPEWYQGFSKGVAIQWREGQRSCPARIRPKFSGPKSPVPPLPQLGKLLRADARIVQDLLEEAPAKVLAWVDGDNGGAAITMPEKGMASILPHPGETQLLQNPDNLVGLRWAQSSTCLRKKAS